MASHRISIAAVALIMILAGEGCKKEPPVVPPDLPPMVDTTNHDFVWTIDTLGDANSQLNDVAIINDTCVWAVGAMHLLDSNRNYIYPIYNAAYWNAKHWNLKRITTSYNGDQITAPLEGVFAFSPTDIWVSAGIPIHGDGNSWTQYHLFDMGVLSQIDGSVNKIWGTSSTNLYTFGDKGTIVYYNGANWQKVESGTTSWIQDVWGAYDPMNGDLQIFAVVSNKYTSGERKICRIRSNTVLDTLSWSPQRRIHSVWFSKTASIYACGAGIFVRQNDTWKEMTDVPLTFTNRIRGNAENDIVVAGDFGILAHYNGKSWKVYPEVALPNGNYESVAIRKDYIVAVGWSGDRAIVTVGRRR